MPDLSPLKGARIWLSGALPPEMSSETADSFRGFVTRLSEQVFGAGGSIIHGSHPTIVPTLLKAAKKYQDAQGSRDCLMLVASKFFRSEYEADLEEWQSRSLVHELPAHEGPDKDKNRAESLKELRDWIADRCDAIIVIGGKWWNANPGAAGIPQEFELAHQRGLPCFLLAGLGGAIDGYLQAFPEVLRDLKNGLDEAENRKLAAERNVETLATEVFAQLCRLPLVRGEALGDSTFRILSLDGGGIKGTFTAAVLAKWEAMLRVDDPTFKLTDYFDLIAGTSTGGILALGLGMGLSASEMLKFYVDRGPVVFPVTSLSRKFWYALRRVVRPKFAQDTLRTELQAAFKTAKGKIMSDSACRLVIPTVQAYSGSVYLFRTNHHPNLIADREATAIDVALATSAAPTYFQAAKVNESAYVDGGVWANNPALAAVVEATSRLHVPLNRVDILSIGTTSEPFSGRSVMKAGAIGWLWGGIIDLLMHAQAQGTIALAKSLIGRPRMLRIDEELAPGGVSLDNVSRIPELKAYGNDIASDDDLIADVKARFFNRIKVAAWSRYPSP